MSAFATLTGAAVMAAEKSPTVSPTPIDPTPSLVGSLLGTLVAVLIVVIGGWWLIRRAGR